MFQNVINGNPVVVGNNPPMKDFVEANGFGICVDTDGSDVNKIIKGLEDLISNYDKYKSNVMASSGQILWNSQNETIKKIVESFLE